MSSYVTLGFIVAIALGTVAEGASAADPAPTELVMSETATREVEQDVLVATVGFRAEAADSGAAQAAVNQVMTAAVDKVRATAGVRPATGGYRVHRRYDRDGNPQQWIAEQDLRLQSEDAAALLELVGALQEDGLALGQLSYQLSATARRTTEDQLTIEAIQALRQRADEVAASLDMRVAAIDMLQVGGAPPARPMPRAAMAEAMAAAPPPVALPDLQTVEATVQATFALVPR